MVAPPSYLLKVSIMKGCQRVKLKMLLLIYDITHRLCAAVELAFQCIVRHTADHLPGQIDGIVFGVAQSIIAKSEYRSRNPTESPCATGILAKKKKVDRFRYSRIKTIDLIWCERGDSNPHGVTTRTSNVLVYHSNTLAVARVL